MQFFGHHHPGVVGGGVAGGAGVHGHLDQAAAAAQYMASAGAGYDAMYKGEFQIMFSMIDSKIFYFMQLTVLRDITVWVTALCIDWQTVHSNETSTPVLLTLPLTGTLCDGVFTKKLINNFWNIAVINFLEKFIQLELFSSINFGVEKLFSFHTLYRHH